MLKIMPALLASAAVMFCYACLAVLRGARRSASVRAADVAIVLGAAVRGEVPSGVFARRIEQGVFLYTAGRVPALIFTGGAAVGAPLAESEVAMNYARRLGVPPEAMRCETRSTSTWTNLVEALAIMDVMRAKTALIVSDAMHLRRAMTMAEALAMRASPSPSRPPADQPRSTWVRFWLREAAALLYFWVWRSGRGERARPETRSERR